MFSRFDQWLITSVFQPTVDAMQKQPVWFGRQAAYLFGVVCLIGLLTKSYVMPDTATATTLIISLSLSFLLLWGATALPRFYAIVIGGTGYRLFCLLWFPGMTAFVALTGAPTKRVLINILSDLCWIAFAYFAACRLPKPKAPKTNPKLSYSGT